MNNRKWREYRRMIGLNSAFLFLLMLCFGIVNAEEPDWRDYNLLLQNQLKPIRIDGVTLIGLNYSAIKQAPEYAKALEIIQSFPLSKLKSREEKLAFYINAYNIFAIKMVLDHWPLKSIKDAGGIFSSVWKKDIGRLGGRQVSLHVIEHEILRKMNEPRIHMAIVCASVSCPDLRNEAYNSKMLEKQLTEQTIAFLNNDKKGLRLKGNELELSKIFDWFEDDFDSLGGVIAFIKSYRKDLPARVEIDDYMSYNWKLNIQ